MCMDMHAERILHALNHVPRVVSMDTLLYFASFGITLVLCAPHRPSLSFRVSRHQSVLTLLTVLFMLTVSYTHYYLCVLGEGYSYKGRLCSLYLHIVLLSLNLHHWNASKAQRHGSVHQGP